MIENENIIFILPQFLFIDFVKKFGVKHIIYIYIHYCNILSHLRSQLPNFGGYS